MKRNAINRVPRFSDRMNHASTLSRVASSNVESGELLGLRLESEDQDDCCKHVVYFTLAH